MPKIFILRECTNYHTNKQVYNTEFMIKVKFMINDLNFAAYIKIPLHKTQLEKGQTVKVANTCYIAFKYFSSMVYYIITCKCQKLLICALGQYILLINNG